MPPRKKYDKENLAKAMEAVSAGAKLGTAAKKYGVPRTTLIGKIKGKRPLNARMGPKTYLTNDEEYLLEQWVIAMSDKHMPVTRDQLLDSVQKIITEKGTKTPFLNNRPGPKWYKLFLNRHPIVRERTAQNLTTARNNVSEAAILNWFEEIGSYLQEKGIREALDDPRRVFNADESAFYLAPKPGKVLAKKGDKHVYASSGDEKENLTVLITGNAAGQFAPPMVVFDYERIPAAVIEKFPKEFAIGRSQTGWMVSCTFYEFITNIFLPWLEQQEDIQRPVVFFLDGHASHLTLHLSQFCAEHGIEIIALNPNSTHIMQPMDVAVFRPLKASWKKTVTDWKLKHGHQNLKKVDFGPLLKEALQNITPECLKNGFRASGLCPFGPEHIDMTKIKTNSKNKEMHETEIDQTPQEQFLERIESEINNKLIAGKLEHFEELYHASKDKLNDLVPNEDKSLYILWASTKQEAERRRGFQAADVLNREIPVENHRGESSRTLDSQSKSPGPSVSSGIPMSRRTTFPAGQLPQNGNLDGSSTVADEELYWHMMDHSYPLTPSKDDLPMHMMDHNYQKTPVKDKSCSQNSALSSLSVVRSLNDEKNDLAKSGNSKVLQSNTTVQKTPGNCSASSSVSPSVLQEATKIIKPDIQKNPVQDNCSAASSIGPGIVQQVEHFTGSVQSLSCNNRSEAPSASQGAMEIIRPETQMTPAKSHESPMKIGGCIVPSPFKRNLFWPDEVSTSTGKKRKTKERLPYAVTSQAWQDYHKKKDADKKQKLELKEKKAKQRHLNKLLKEKNNQEKQMRKTDSKDKKLKPVKVTKCHGNPDTDTDTDTEVKYCESDDSPYDEIEEEEDDEIEENVPIKLKSKGKGIGKGKKNNPESIKEGNYVIVRYEGEYFPGVVETVGNDSRIKKYEISTMSFSAGKTYKWPEHTDKIWYNKADIVKVINPPVLSNKRGFYTVKEMEEYLPFTV